MLVVGCCAKRRLVLEGLYVEQDPRDAGDQWFWKGCKPNFVCALRRRESFVLATDTRNLPAFADAERAAPRFPIWPCTRRGFPCRVACASRGALLPHLFTLAVELALKGGLIFCGTVRRNVSQRSARVYLLKFQKLRGVAPCGVRTFLPRLAPEAILRPSKTEVKLTGIRNFSSREMCLEKSRKPPPCCQHNELD
jgi:hypothetical protein